MSSLAKKLYIRNSAGTQQTANIYDDVTEAYPAYMHLTVDGTTAYIPIVATNDSKATIGRVTESNGVTYAIASRASVPYNSAYYTSTGSFTVPSGVYRVRVTCVGGGAGSVIWFRNMPRGTNITGYNGGGTTSFGSLVSASGATSTYVSGNYEWVGTGESQSHEWVLYGYTVSQGTTNATYIRVYGVWVAGGPAVPLTRYDGSVAGYAGAGGQGNAQYVSDFSTTGASGYKTVSVVSVTPGTTIQCNVGAGGPAWFDWTTTYEGAFGNSGRHVWPGSAGAILVEYGGAIETM